MVQHQQLYLLLPQRETLIYSFVHRWSKQILKLTHCKRVFSAALDKRKKTPQSFVRLNKALGWREQSDKDLDPSYRNKHENTFFFFFKVNGVLGQPATESELCFWMNVWSYKNSFPVGKLGEKAIAFFNAKQLWMAAPILAYSFAYRSKIFFIF